jgi:hypothetical protein
MKSLIAAVLIVLAVPAHAANDRAMRSINHFRALQYRAYLAQQYRVNQPYHGTPPLARDRDGTPLSLGQYWTRLREQKNVRHNAYTRQLDGFLNQNR